jgi:hypothetical protein
VCCRTLRHMPLPLPLWPRAHSRAVLS